MIQSFSDLYTAVEKLPRAVLAVAVAQDKDVLARWTTHTAEGS